MCCNNRAARKALQQASCACLEQLEVRRMLSASTALKAPPVATASYCDGELEICGTEGRDTVSIFDDAKNGKVTLWIDKNGDCQIEECELTEYCDVEEIDADLKGGDDKVKYVLVSDMCRDEREVEIDLGCGDDTFCFESGYGPLTQEPTATQGFSEPPQNGGSADITDCSEFELEVEGDDGDDKMTFDFSRTSIIKSEVEIEGDGGKGDDCIEYILPQIGFVNGEQSVVQQLPGFEYIDDSCVEAEFNLGDGCNVMRIEALTLIADSEVETCIKGGKNSDKVYDQQFFGLIGCTEYEVKADLGKGDDTYCQTMSAENFIDCKAKACFEVKAGDGCDEVKSSLGGSVRMKPALASSVAQPVVLGGIQGSLAMLFDGGKHNDKVEIDFSCDALYVGEKGQLKLSAKGGDGNDCVSVAVRVDEYSAGCYEISVCGDGGDDKVALGFQDDSCGAYNPQAAAVASSSKSSSKSKTKLSLDGGKGCDSWDTEGNKGEEVCPRNVEKLCEELLSPFCSVVILPPIDL